MVKNSTCRTLPQIAIEAYDLLLQHRLIDITKPLDWGTLVWNSKKQGWIFECNFTIPFPNKNNLPHVVPFQVLIPEEFPYVPVEFYSLSEDVKAFPHQDAESGKLCLHDERDAPRSAERLVQYVKWAIEWLIDAANGTLLKDGDPYELPDFSRKLLNYESTLKEQIAFNECQATYEIWRSYIGKQGTVEFIAGKTVPAVFATKFLYNNTLLYEAHFSDIVLNLDRKIQGIWFIVSDVRYKNHRPPHTYAEIEKLCIDNGMKFYDILNSAWQIDNQDTEIGLTLVGFPIPKYVGQDLIEIHWQPIVFKNFRALRKEYNTKKIHKIWSKCLKENGYFNYNNQIPWSKSSNINVERIYSRSSYNKSIRDSHIAIFGCGALGSIIAELLSRGGVQSISLFDPDNLLFGNLCRHTLDGSHVGSNKARALAVRLSGTNPLAKINYYEFGVPFNLVHLQKCDDFSNAGILIDSTASDSAFEWLNHYAATRNKKLVSLFITFHAEYMILLVSGIKTNCSDIYEDVIKSVTNKEVPINAEIFFNKPKEEEQIIEGAGCWHPTFPASNAHIWMLATTALDIVSHNIEYNNGSGLAVIIKRNQLEQKIITIGSYIEIIWLKQYS